MRENEEKKNVLELLEYINQATQTLIGWMCDGNESMNEVLPYSILLLLLLSVLFIHSQLIHYVLPHLMMCGVCVCVCVDSISKRGQSKWILLLSVAIGTTSSNYVYPQKNALRNSGSGQTISPITIEIDDPHHIRDLTHGRNGCAIDFRLL